MTYQHNIMDSHINEQVQHLYSQGLQAIPRDAFVMFWTPVEELVKKPKLYKEKWVASSFKVAMKQKQNHKHRAYISEQWGMQQWLGLEEI